MTIATRYIYRALFLLLPLIFYKNTSELFEFNKLTLIYAASAIVFSLWIVNSYIEKRLLIEKNIYTKAIFVFLIAMTIATFTSIDMRTSIFGYYSRFSGGLLSILALSILSIAYPIYIDRKEVKLHILILLISTVIASLWGVMEHFGKSPSCLLLTGRLDVECWIQDVAHRVFAGFGQPNWMAAWLAAAIPISFVYKLNFKNSSFDKLFFVIPPLLILALLFTKSRSGILATALSLGILLVLCLFRQQKETLKRFPVYIALTIPLLIFFGTPWTNSIENKFLESKNKIQQVSEVVAPKLETGGTESGEIRKIVWEGALAVFSKYPIMGSGLETFAMSYYEGRPVSHNLTSEWNYLYNKAHNEYLNYLATTGIVGFFAYLFLIISILIHSFPRKKDDILIFSIFAGFTGLLVSNFFGFATSTTLFLFFMAPSMVSSIRQKEPTQKTTVSSNYYYIAAGISLVFLFLLSRYWYADYLYASAKNKFADNDIASSFNDITKAIQISPNEPIYHDMSAQALTAYALSSEEDDAELYLNYALAEVQAVQKLSPRNIKLAKSQINILSDLANLNPDTLLMAKKIADNVATLAPTDPSVPYQQGLIVAKLGLTDEAIVYIKKAINLKPNYKIARQLLAYLYTEKDMRSESREQYLYILEHISPEDNSIKEELEKLL